MPRDAGPRAVVVLVRDGLTVPLGPVGADGPCDLGLIDGLLRLRLHAGRLGWWVQITEVRPELRELFDLVGLLDQVEGDQLEGPSIDDGRPNASNSSG